MEEINLKELYEFFVKHIVTIVLGVGFLMVIGFVYVLFLQKPMYQATTTLLLTTEETVITQGDLRINRDLIQTYREVVQSKNILGATLKQTTYNLSINELGSMVDVTAVPNTDVLKITVRSDEPTQPHVLANVIAHNFIDLVRDVYNIEHIAIVDAAEAPEEPYNKNFPLQVVIITLISFLVASFIAILVYFLDDTIKDEKAIEESFDVPVIGIIPFEKGAKK